MNPSRLINLTCTSVSVITLLTMSPLLHATDLSATEVSEVSAKPARPDRLDLSEIDEKWNEGLLEEVTKGNEDPALLEEHRELPAISDQPIELRLEKEEDEKPFISLSGESVSEETVYARTGEENRPVPPYLGLSIDGGGIRGLMPALWLRVLEDEIIPEGLGNKGVPLYKVFDYMGGTSIGGILALGLSKPIAARELVDILETENQNVFPKSSYGLFNGIHDTWNWFSYRYDHRPLEKLLQEKFGDTRLKHAQCNVLVTSCSTDGTPVLFKSKKNSVKMWRVARATSAAPTYFQAYTLEDQHLVDGGLWANNPSVLVVGHLIHEYKAKVKDIRLLSLGTGDAPNSSLIAKGTGKLASIRPVLDTLMSSHNIGNHLAMKELLKGNYYRVNPKLKRTIQLDNTEPKTIEYLKDIADSKQCYKALYKFYESNEELIRQKLESQDEGGEELSD